MGRALRRITEFVFCAALLCHTSAVVFAQSGPSGGISGPGGGAGANVTVPTSMSAVIRNSSFFCPTDTPPPLCYRFAPRILAGSFAWGFPGATWQNQFQTPSTDLTGMTTEEPRLAQNYAAISAMSPNGNEGVWGNCRAQDNVLNATCIGITSTAISDKVGVGAWSGYDETRTEGVLGPNPYTPTGSGYVPSPTTATGYHNVPLTGGSGTGMTADIRVNAAGQVVGVIETLPGVGYLPGDMLSANNSYLGGTGSGFSWTLQSVLYAYSVTTNAVEPAVEGWGREIDVINRNQVTWHNPFQANGGVTGGLILAAHGEYGTGNPDYAMDIGRNYTVTPAAWEEGILFESVGLQGCDGVTVGTRCDAVEMSLGMQQRWWFETGSGGSLRYWPGFTEVSDVNLTAGEMSMHVANGHIYFGGSVGAITGLSLATPGSGLASGTYSNITLNDASGRFNTFNGGQSGAATVTVSGGGAGTPTLPTNPSLGQNYLVGDILTMQLCTLTVLTNCLTQTVIGSGVAPTFTVTSIQDSTPAWDVNNTLIYGIITGNYLQVQNAAAGHDPIITPVALSDTNVGEWHTLLGTGTFGIHPGADGIAFDVFSAAGSSLFKVTTSGAPTVSMAGAISATASVIGQFLGVAPTTWADTQACTAGWLVVDSNYIYVCTAANTVKRAALSAF